MESAFDPASFLDVTISQVQERRNPLPENVYNAMVGAPVARAGVSEKDPSKPKHWLAWDFPLTIDVPADIQGALELPPTLKFTHTVFVELTPAKTIAMGRGENNAIRLFREALDLNKPGDTFNPRMAEGRMVKANIKHELYEGVIRERIAGVVRA